MAAPPKPTVVIRAGPADGDLCPRVFRPYKDFARMTAQQHRADLLASPAASLSGARGAPAPAESPLADRWEGFLARHRGGAPPEWAAVKEVQRAALDEVRRETREELLRPNQYFEEARRHAERFQSDLAPLLERADRAAKRMEEDKYVRNHRLLQELATRSGRRIVLESEDLVAAVLDDLILDTVSEFSRIDAELGMCEEAAQRLTELDDVWALAEQIELDEKELRAQYGLLAKQDRVLEPEDEVELGLDPGRALFVKPEPYDARRAAAAKPQPKPAAGAAAAARKSVTFDDMIPVPASLRPGGAPEPPAVEIGGMSERTAERIRRQRDRYDEYVLRVRKKGHADANPWLLVEICEDDILDDLLRHAANEILSLCDGYVDRVCRNEFTAAGA